MIEHESHPDHHVVHDFMLQFLIFISWRRHEQFLLHDEQSNGHNRQQVKLVSQEGNGKRHLKQGVRSSQVIHPQERSAPQLDGVVQSGIQTKENRQLHENRQTARQGVIVVLAEQLHLRPAQLLAIIPVFLFEFSNLWL